MGNNHLIHHLILDLILASDKDGLGKVHAEVNEYKDIILKTVSDYFNLISIDENIYIEEVEIDIGAFSSSLQLTEKIKEQLDIQFKKLSINKGTPQKSASFVIEYGKRESLNASSPLSNLLHFLKTGHALWDLAAPDFTNKIQHRKDAVLLKNFFSSQTASEIIKTIVEKPSFFWRLQFYFPEVTAAAIPKLSPEFSNYSPFHEIIWKDFLKVFSKIHSQYAVKTWQSFFQVILRQPQQIEDIDLFFYLMMIAIRNKDISFQNHRHFQHFALEKPVAISKNAREIIRNYFPLYPVLPPEINEMQAFRSKNTFENKKDIFLKNHEAQMFADLDNSESAALYLPYCGIIFLHPWLQRFFEQEGLMLNHQFKNRKSKIKAVQLLYYLATFETRCRHEIELDYFKTLVEIPVEDFIRFEKALNPEEKFRCLELLKSCISEWSVLKKTAPETVQNQFLKRKGILKIEEKSIEIQLEKSGVDILLEHYPYNYSIVKLGWLKKIIITVV